MTEEAFLYLVTKFKGSDIQMITSSHQWLEDCDIQVFQEASA
jgi:hypothetical protein